MGKVQSFQIVLDNPSKIYFAGQTISGRVIIILTDSMEIRGVHLQIKGKAEVRWSETNSDESDTTYSASETYLNYFTILYGDGNKIMLPSGEHCFTFSHALPPGLPSSFESSDGHIRYFCKCNIDRPWKFDPVSKQFFTVNSIVDLNLESKATNSAIDQAQKKLCCFCCRSGRISATANISRIGYVPGEYIHINGEIINLTNTVVNKTRAVLKAMITYHASSNKKKERKEIAEVKRDSIEPGESDLWNAVPLQIPPVPPSYLVGCGIIDIQYTLEFIVQPARPSFDLVLTLPIIIGTIPLRKYFTIYDAQPPTYSEAVNYLSSAPQ